MTDSKENNEFCRARESSPHCFPWASHFNFFSVFSYTSQHENDCRKTIFLYAGWRTHLLRFHGERPYHVRVESQVVVSLGASEFFFPLKVGAF